MTDLEHFGTPCQLPEDNPIGDCPVCGGEMVNGEVCICEICGETVHLVCIKDCHGCGYSACQKCMIEKDDKYYCSSDCEE